MRLHNLIHGIRLHSGIMSRRFRAKVFSQWVSLNLAHLLKRGGSSKIAEQYLLPCNPTLGEHIGLVSPLHLLPGQSSRLFEIQATNNYVVNKFVMTKTWQ
jgi:hypothetical protein